MPKWDPFRNPEQTIELFLTLYKTNHKLVKGLEEQIQQYELTLGRLCLLVSLKRFGMPALPSQLSDDLAVTRANISGLLNALEKTQLIKRDIDLSNRRRVLVRLTETGESLLEKVWPIYVQTISGNIKAKLSPEEQKLLTMLLKKLG